MKKNIVIKHIDKKIISKDILTDIFFDDFFFDKNSVYNHNGFWALFFFVI